VRARPAINQASKAHRQFKFRAVLARTQPFLSRSVEKRGDQSRFKCKTSNQSGRQGTQAAGKACHVLYLVCWPHRFAVGVRLREPTRRRRPAAANKQSFLMSTHLTTSRNLNNHDDVFSPRQARGKLEERYMLGGEQRKSVREASQFAFRTSWGAARPPPPPLLHPCPSPPAVSRKNVSSASP
jgi:hypothetical protein